MQLSKVFSNDKIHSIRIYRFDNFGDEAIAKVLVDRLKHEGAEKITLISSNPEKTQNFMVLTAARC